MRIPAISVALALTIAGCESDAQPVAPADAKPAGTEQPKVDMDSLDNDNQLDEVSIKSPDTERTTASTMTHVIKKTSEYYKGGPQQAQPPDGTFEVGTKVSLIDEAGSYSLVRAKDGTEAYVSSGSLDPIK